MITQGSQVSIEYTLKLSDGSVADTNVGGEALTYEQGADQILPGLERELAGLAPGDTKQVSLSAADGYGEVDPALYHTVPAAEIPEGARSVGTQLMAETTDGRQRPVRVREVKGDEIVLDLNHPLAGEALDFEVKILAVEPGA